MGQSGMEPAGDYTFLYEKEMRVINQVQVFVHKGIISAVKTTEFVCDRMSYTVLRGCWFQIIVLMMDLKTEWCSTDQTDLAENRGQWRAPVNMVLNLRIP